MNSQLTWQEFVGTTAALIYYVELVIYLVLHPLLLVITVGAVILTTLYLFMNYR